VNLADDRRHVVLAMGFEGDAAQDHHLVVAAHLLEGALEEFARILVVRDDRRLVVHSRHIRPPRPYRQAGRTQLR
jgi:hypothetical protein